MIDYNLFMRRVLSQIFTKQKSIIEKYFSQDFKIDARIAPKDLLQWLKDKKKIRKFIAKMNEAEKNSFSLLQKYIVVHLCLIYTTEHIEVFRKINFKQSGDNQWIDLNILQPYSTFLQKICCSEEFYKMVLSDGIIEFNFDNLFFTMKLLKDLLSCRKKISSLFHYYSKNTLTIYPFLLQNYVCIIAFHAQRIYSVFKAILVEFIRFPKKYLIKVESESIIKFILEHQLAKINEDLRQLFLNSYFFPLGKGYGIKLIKVEDLPDETRDYAESILYQSRIRIKSKKMTLDSIIFDRTGKINTDIYRGLQRLTNGEEGAKIKRMTSAQNFKMVKEEGYGQQIEDI